MKIKKYLAIMLCFMLSLSLLVSCGSKDEDDNKETTPSVTATEAPTEAPTSTPTPTPTVEPTATPTPEPTPEPVADNLTLEDYLGVWYMQSGEIEGDEYTALDEGILSTISIRDNGKADMYRAFWYDVAFDNGTPNIDIKDLEYTFYSATADTNSYIMIILPEQEASEENADATDENQNDDIVDEVAEDDSEFSEDYRERIYCYLNEDKTDLTVDHYFFYDGTIPVAASYVYTKDEITIDDILPQFYKDAAFIPYVVGQDRYNGFDDEGCCIWSVCVPYVAIYDGYEEIEPYITDSMSLFTRDLKKYGVKSMDEVQFMKENGGGLGTFFDESKVTVVRSDTKIFSALLNTGSYLGGTHPDTFLTTYNFSGNSGALLVLDDIFEDKSQLKTILVEKLQNENPDVSFFDLEATIEAEVNDGSIKFLVCNDNVSFYFSPYELAPYALGIISTSLSYDEYKDIIYDEYFTGPKSFSMILNDGTPYYMDFDGNGTIDKLEIFERLNEYEDIEAVLFYMNGELVLEQNLEFNSYDLSEILFKTDDGKMFIYLEGVHSSDDYYIACVELAPEGFNYVGLVGESFAGYSVLCDNWKAEDEYENYTYVKVAFDPKNIVLSERNEILGTRFVLSRVSVDADGKFLDKESKKFFSGNSELTLIKDFEVEPVAMNLSPLDDPETKVLPAGTSMTPVGIENDSIVYFLLQDGTFVKADLADVDVFEIFVGMLFAD